MVSAGTTDGGEGALAVLAMVGGKWKVRILLELLCQARHFGELQRRVLITPRVLTRQLRDLEEDRLIARTVHSGAPVRVEYSLTELGRSLQPLLQQMSRWGHHYRARTAEHQEDEPRTRPGSSPAA